MRNLDELDLRIISECSADSRQSIRQISRKVNAAPSTVQERIRRLEKMEIIKGYSAIIDHEKLGYEFIIVVQLIISQGKLLEVERKLAKIPEVVAVYDLSGPFDAIVIARFKTKREASTFVKKLLAMRYVERTTTHIVLNVIK